MSLQIWLPMTKDLKNQGIADVEITNNGATLDSAGKLGGCYYFNRSTSNYLKISNPLTSSLNEISMAFWVKLPSNGSVNDQLVHIGNGSGWNNNRFTCFVRANNPFLVFVCGDGSSSTTYSCASSHLTLNQWTHIVCTYNNGTMRIYLNGILNKEYVTNIVPSFANTPYIGIGAGPNSTEPATAYLNDVRIYSHCLSQKEISELKKALVLHYCLDNNGVGNKNISSKYVSCGSGNPDNTNNGGRTKYYGDYGVIIPAVEKADTYFTIWTTEPLENGQVYTLSANVSGLIEGTYYVFPLFAQGNSSMGTICFDHNGRNSLTFTMNYTGTVNTATVDGKTYYKLFMDDINRDIASGQGEITINNIKLEKGTIATPWCPNSSDALYTALGYDDGIEYDTSGYGHNGTSIDNTLTYSIDSPRYLASTVFNGTTSGLIFDNLDLNPIFNNDCTISFWVKSNDDDKRSVFFSAYSNATWGIEKTVSNHLRSYWNGSPDTVFSNGGTITSADGWIHICLVKTGDSNLKMYRNGVLTQTVTSTMSTKNFSTTWRMGRDSRANDGTPFHGNLSDFRVYASCLSDTEIQKLYTVSASIDSNGNAYSAAYVEG